MTKKGKVIDGIWYPDALAENDIPNFEEYKSEAVRLALKMGSCKAICTDSVSRNFYNNVPVGLAARDAYEDTIDWGG